MALYNDFACSIKNKYCFCIIESWKDGKGIERKISIPINDLRCKWPLAILLFYATLRGQILGTCKLHSTIVKKKSYFLNSHEGKSVTEKT